MRSQKAFTLVEVMISVVILAVGLSVVLRSFLQCLNAIGASKDYMLSAAAAKAKMNDVLEAALSGNNTTYNLSSGNLISGSEIMGNRNFTWQVALKAAGQSEFLSGNYTEAAVTYTWKEGNRQPSLSCHMYVPQIKTPEKAT
jgi:prepilin-type N-terminal cleavage/methylation domain-containing protein